MAEGNDEQVLMVTDEGTFEIVEVEDDEKCSEDLLKEAEGDGSDEEIGKSSSFPHDTSLLSFTSHEGPVYCSSISPGGEKAATGGGDDHAYVWDVRTGEILSSLSGHKDSIVQVHFSSDGSLLASADMSGLIQVWKSPDFKKEWDVEFDDITWIEWHPKAHILLGGSTSGAVGLWLVPSSEAKVFASSTSSSCTTGSFFPNGICIVWEGKQAVVGYENGGVQILDLKKGHASHTLVDGQNHEAEVTCVAVHSDNRVILTGSSDATAKIINSSNMHVVGMLSPGHGGVECAGFSPPSALSSSGGVIAALGTIQGSLSFWDLSTQVNRASCTQESGIVKLAWDPAEALIYTGGLDGTLRSFDPRTGSQVRLWVPHSQEILDFSLSWDGRTVVTTSEDGTCRVIPIS